MAISNPVCQCDCGCAAPVDSDGEGGYWPRCRSCQFRPTPRCTKSTAILTQIERRLANIECRLEDLDAQHHAEPDPSAWLRVVVPPPFDPDAPLTDTEREYVLTGAVTKR